MAAESNSKTDWRSLPAETEAGEGGDAHLADQPLDWRRLPSAAGPAQPVASEPEAAPEAAHAMTPDPPQPEASPSDKLSPDEFGERAAEGSTAPHRDTISDKEIQAISERSGVPVERIRELTPRFGVIHSGSGFGDAAVSGFAHMDEAGPTMGLVGALYKKLGLSEAEQRAMDDVQALNRAKGSWFDAAVDIAGSVVGGAPSRVAKGIAQGVAKGAEAGLLTAKGAGEAAGRLAEAATTGAVLGAAHSETDKELEGAESGALLGTAFGAGGELLGAAARKVGRDNVRNARLGDKLAHENPVRVDLEAHAASLAPAEKEADDALWSVLSNPEARKRLRKGPEQAVELAAELPKETQQLLFGMKHGQASANPLDDVAEVMQRGLNDLEYRSGRAVESGATLEDIEAMEPGRLEEAFHETRDTDRMRRVKRAFSPQIDETVGRLEHAMGKLEDARYRASRIDDRNSTKLEPALDRLSAGVNQVQHEVTEALIDGQKAIGLTRKAVKEKGSTEQKIGRLVELGETADEVRAEAAKAGALPEEIDAAVAIREWFDKHFERANEAGAGLQKLGSAAASRAEAAGKAAPAQLLPTKGREERGYFRQQVARVPDYMARVADRAEGEFGLDMERIASGKLDASDRAKLEAIAEAAQRAPDGTAADFLKGISLGEEQLPTTAAEVRARLEQAMDPTRSTERLEQFASVQKERSGTPIPEWVREHSIGQLMANWAHDAYAAAHLKEPIREMSQIADVLSNGAEGAAERSRGSEDAKWVRNLVADLRGSRGDTLWSEARHWATKKEAAGIRKAMDLERQADEHEANGDKWLAKRARFEAAVQRDLSNPLTLISKATAQMYPTYLGALNPVKAIRNASQPFMMTFPELGTAYGGSVAVRSVKKLLTDAAAYKRLVMEEGLRPHDQAHEIQEAIRQGVSRSDIARKASAFTRGLAKTGMFLYQLAEGANRMLTRAAADVLAEDALRAIEHAQQHGSMRGADAGAKKAAAFVAAMGKGYRTEVGNSLRAGDLQGAAKTLGAYLNGKTQLNYNRAAMHEFGREMGPLLAMFSKWPTSVGADVAHAFRKTGDADIDAFRRSQRYAKWLAPMAALGAGEALIRMGGLREQAPATQLALGTDRDALSGLGAMHPLNSLVPMLSGRYLPPLLSEPSAIAGHIAKGEFGRAAGRAGRAVLSITPAGQLAQFWTQVWPLLNNEEPEK